MKYELYRMGKTRAGDMYISFATSLVNARKRAMELYMGRTILIKRVSKTSEMDSGYVAENSDGFYYRNLETREIYFLNADGTVQ